MARTTPLFQFGLTSGQHAALQSAVKPFYSEAALKSVEGGRGRKWTVGTDYRMALAAVALRDPAAGIDDRIRGLRRRGDKADGVSRQHCA